MLADMHGHAALYYVCVLRDASSLDIISKLVVIGGKELVMMTDRYRQTVLHHVCDKNASLDIISKLVEIGGREQLAVKAKKYDRLGTALHFFFFPENQWMNYQSNFNTVITFLTKEYILAGIDGECFGWGLFNDCPKQQDLQNNIYK